MFKAEVGRSRLGTCSRRVAWSILVKINWLKAQRRRPPGEEGTRKQGASPYTLLGLDLLVVFRCNKFTWMCSPAPWWGQLFWFQLSLCHFIYRHFWLTKWFRLTFLMIKGPLQTRGRLDLWSHPWEQKRSKAFSHLHFALSLTDIQLI